MVDQDKIKAVFYLDTVTRDGEIVMELKTKMVPDHALDLITEKSGESTLMGSQLRDMFNDFDEWEDFDRMKHMTEEQRRESDSMKGLGDIINESI